MTTSGGEVARGRALHVGSGAGPAMAIGPLSFWGGIDWADGRIIDVHHEAHGRSIRDTVLVMPHGRGSSSAAAVMAELIRAGSGPAAVVMRSADVILVVGAIAAAELYDVDCPIVELEPDAFERVVALDGQHLAVTAVGEVGVVLSTT
jgi:predicted aconitase with swiveling domain